MPNNALNNSLQRTLLDGKQYNALFSASNCTPNFLGEGTTKFGIDEIKKWILDNLHQVNQKEAIKHFKKATIKETVAAIHYFTYNHFQYNADGYKQNLFSPACAWARRKKGIDCKSYTIIASALLLHCGIKHHLTRIKQPNENPDLWSHIYINVPKNQTTGNLNDGYYTLDGTINTFQEPIYLDQDNVFMKEVKLPYYGLQGTSPFPTTNNSTQQQVVANFFNFAKFLHNAGEDLEFVNKMIRLVNDQLAKGNINFSFTITRTGFVVEGVPFNLSPDTFATIYKASTGGLNGTGLVDGINLGDEGSGSAGSSGSFFESIPVEDITSAISSSGWFSDTFGNIFSNGFNLSCWNASLPPSYVKECIEKGLKPYFFNINKKLEESNTNLAAYQAQLNHVVSMTYRIWQFFRYQAGHADWSSCSREGQEMFQLYMDKVKPLTDDLIQRLETHFIVDKTIDQHRAGGLVLPTNLTNWGSPFKMGNNETRTVDVPVLRLTPKQTSNNTSGGVQTGSGTSTTTGLVNTGNDSNIPRPETKKAGFGIFGWGLALTAVGLGVKEYMNKNNSEPKKTK